MRATPPPQPCKRRASSALDEWCKHMQRVHGCLEVQLAQACLVRVRELGMHGLRGRAALGLRGRAAFGRIGPHWAALGLSPCDLSKPRGHDLPGHPHKTYGYAQGYGSGATTAQAETGRRLIIIGLRDAGLKLGFYYNQGARVKLHRRNTLSLRSTLSQEHSLSGVLSLRSTLGINLRINLRLR